MTAAAVLPALFSWRARRADGHDATAFAAPPQVPGYRMLRPVGEGRRTVAWLAYDLAQGCDVVLKLERAPGASLERDALVARRVQSPHLVRVLGQGRAGDWCFVALEHVEGGDLARRLRQPLPREEALSLFTQAARALAALHRAGLVHRDVKPANFLLRADGRLVLADFGLVTEAGAVDPRSADGGIVGTPRYVAPEQLQGAPASCAADVYSLGVLLHEMLTGRPPFSGETLMEVCSQHLLARPALLPAALADLQPLVHRMLCKEVHTRLPDAEAVLGLTGQRC